MVWKRTTVLFLKVFPAFALVTTTNIHFIVVIHPKRGVQDKVFRFLTLSSRFNRA